MAPPTSPPASTLAGPALRAAPSPAAGRAALPPVRGHLDQVDLFRTLTFASVVAVHAFAFTNAPDGPVAGGVAMLLHYTREAFFFLTGFVLVHAQRDRELQVRSFWTRRLRLVAVPYLVWSTLYWAVGQWQSPRSPGLAASDLVWGVLGGHSAFHLYFLVVTLQVYLAFPLLLRLVRAARRAPLALAGAALLYELLAMWWVHDLSPDTGAGGWLAGKAYVLAPTYLFWVLLGMLCAQHLPAVQGHLVTHRSRVARAGLLAVAGGLAWYAWRVSAGASPADSDASATLQPVMVVLSLGVIALLALASTSWALARPAHPRLARVVTWCSSASFGVYLVHALVLDRVLALGLHGPTPSLVGQPWAALLAWLLALAGSAALVAGLRRTPLSLALTGRGRTRPGVSVTPGRPSRRP